jgi:hypothetical protein
MATCTHTQTEPISFGIDTIELAPLPEQPSNQRKLGTADPESVSEEAIPPLTAVNALQKWNSPGGSMWRVFAAFWSFFVVGMNDGSYGVSRAMLP